MWSMGDTAGEVIACQHCDSEVQVPAESSRFQAAVAHFEAEHVSRSQGSPGTGGTSRAGATAEEAGASD